MVSFSVLAAVVVMSGVAERAAGVDAPCLEYAACYKEAYLHHSHLEIHHYDHDTRSASSCLPVCLEYRPSTQLVMAKIIEMNERLVCGCGDKEALGSGRGATEDLVGCNPCPDGEEKCGGAVTVSIYRVEQSGKCRKGLHPYPLIATTATTTTITTTTTTPGLHEGELVIEPSSKVEFLGYVEVSSDERSALRLHLLPSAGGEAERCLSICMTQDSQQHYGFLRPFGGVVLCGCGTRDFFTRLTNPLKKDPTADNPFGNADTFVVYRAGAAPCPLLHPGLALVAAAAVVMGTRAY
ncbi:uncharacterized protein LOC127007122 [Eriocheir sinensis]|uniref:uncharacterized protein LOC127007122 n=1 Tax=Eriocheir sinensis TaxID=95602 RepID=UPI0021C57DC6|nr:uncharacterized protein LOC127007122 [Eriocheir sinensis]